uniref:Phosphorylase b kinase regulatory subunit n=1 Tax=Anopheles christyi TaxID=43041 RepID=A0A182K421_9DIPT
MSDSSIEPAKGTATDLVVQIVLIAESMRLQAMMATYGIQTQTPHEVEPVQIWSSTQLINVYQQLGVNDKIGLTGRPPRPVGSLGTSKVYRICGMTVLCYPLIFEVSDFYLYRDMALLIDDIKTELQFVGKYWRLSGRPTVCLLIREEHMRDPQFKEMIDLLAMLKKGYCDDMKVRIGRLQNLISSSCIEHLDFMSTSDLPDVGDTAFAQIHHDYIGYQSLTDVPRAHSYREKKIMAAEYATRSTPDILEALRNTESIFLQCQLLGIILHREGAHYELAGDSVHVRLTDLYYRAGTLRYWRAVRYCSSLLRHIVDSISPFITTLLVNGKQITVGVIGQRETIFDKPMTPSEIQNVMYSTVQPYDVIHAVLQQEVVLYCGRLIATNPDIFKGILKIRVGWVLEAMRLYLTMKGDEGADIENLSPFQIRQLLQRVLTVSQWANEDHFSTVQRRQLEGCLCRVPSSFYNLVWDVLERTPHGITVQGHNLPAMPTLTNKSRSELSFSLQVEEMLHQITQPERRQIAVELLCIVATILSRNPELRFQQVLDLDLLLEDSFAMYCKDHNLPPSKDVSPLFSLSYSQTTGYLARAAVNSVLQRCALSTEDFADDVHTLAKCLMEDIPVDGVNLLHAIKKLAISNSPQLYYTAIALIFAGLDTITHPEKLIQLYRVRGMDELSHYLEALNVERLQQQCDKMQNIYQLLKLLSLYQNMVIMRHAGKRPPELKEEHKCFAELLYATSTQIKSFRQWLENLSALVQPFGNEQDEDYLILADLIHVDMIPLFDDWNQHDGMM